MTPARLQTIEEIFYAALNKEADQVAKFLDTACEGDELLRRKVETLLASRQRAGSFIETSAVGLATRIIENGQADLLFDRTIGHYKISKRIGTGGMGEVYLATDMTAGRKAALKLLPIRFTGDAERLKRFQQEARAVVGLNHPNILTVYEIGEDHSIHYIASELIEGETLRQRLMRGRMELSEAVDVAIQVASALAAAHEAGIVHRDINPGNIMLRRDGYVKVLDFGIAKLAEQEAPATMPRNQALLLVETNLGLILGTVPYMSPEQACAGPVDKRTDIWSLGVVLYEMVTGHAPFTGDTSREVMASILENEPPPLASYVRHPPAELQQTISRTLRKDRKERYKSASEMLQALKNLRHKLELKAELERSNMVLSWLRWARSPIALAVVLLVSALALALPFYRHRDLATSLPPDNSIAVLPFENRSEDKANAYFADGIQDEILSRLSKIADLKVISRTSTQHYKSLPENLPEVARQLGVAHILEGSVKKSGDAVRVNVQLIKASNHSHLWAETFDRKLTDIFSVESDVAQKIASALEAKLTGEEKNDISSIGTRNPEAYDAYLRALALVHFESDYEALERALHTLKEAVELDANFAAAWALLARIQAQAYSWGTEHTQADRVTATKALETALRLQPELAEVQMAQGYYQYYILRDWNAARQTFELLRRRWPNNADIVTTLGLIAEYQGRWEEALKYHDNAIALSPRDLDLRMQACFVRYSVHDFTAELRRLDQVLTIWPDNTNAILEKVGVYQVLGQLDQAEALLSRVQTEDVLTKNGGLGKRIYNQALLSRDPAAIARAISLLRKHTDPPNSLLPLVHAHGRNSLGRLEQLSGQTKEARAHFTEAREEFEQQLKEQEQHPSLLQGLAEALAGLGEREAALREADLLVERVPSSTDAINGPACEEHRARIQARFGDADHAIPTLKYLLKTVYGRVITPALLRLDPDFDPLRGDPRFQELCKDKQT
jgi:serine/threonine protein kinase